MKLHKTNRQLGLFDEMIIDNFAGGGGASTGIEAALGRPIDVAINHDREAIAMHEANHPLTKHYCESVWEVDPLEVTKGRPVGLAWFSPDCKHFSKAKGGKPVDKKTRGLAWVAIRWAALVRPRIIMLENVEEFITWGPLGPDGKPCPRRKGKTFRAFVRALERHGYTVEWRELVAADYGAPTTRKRLFLIARRDGQPIVWPAPTHNRKGTNGLKKWVPAAEIIDWSLPMQSIFERERPLKEKTLRVMGLKQRANHQRLRYQKHEKYFTVWKTLDGRYIPVYRMQTEHILNVINYFSGVTCADVYPLGQLIVDLLPSIDIVMLAELRRRKIAPEA